LKKALWTSSTPFIELTNKGKIEALEEGRRTGARGL
jgi:hypothetical protein